MSALFQCVLQAASLVSVEESRAVLAVELKAAESGRREAEGEAGRARGELGGRELEVAKLRKTVRDNQAVLEAERKRYFDLMVLAVTLCAAPPGRARWRCP